MKDVLNLIWIDLEMTGLFPESDRIIEIATVVTDKDLNELSRGPVLAIKQPDSILEEMDAWNTRQHGKSGLTDRVKLSNISEANAERQTIEFLSNFLDAGQSPMCGNSVCQDRRFLSRYMPELAAFFHYRNLDVSTLKELARRWKPAAINSFIKSSEHLALADILQSIDELRHYRSTFIDL